MVCVCVCVTCREPLLISLLTKLLCCCAPSMLDQLEIVSLYQWISNVCCFPSVVFVHAK